MAWWVPLAAAGISAAGRLMSRGSGGVSGNMQKQMFSGAIQTRVRDAKLAGIHPLYALGHTPNIPSGFGGSGVGDAIGDIAQGAGQAYQRYQQRGAKRVAQMRAAETHRANTDLTRAQARLFDTRADIAQQQHAASLAARTGQAMNSGQDAIVRPEEVVKGRNGGLVMADRPVSVNTIGGQVAVDPERTPQQVIEDIYGSLVGEAHGVYGMGADQLGRLQRWLRRRRFHGGPEGQRRLSKMRRNVAAQRYYARRYR